MYLYQLLLFSEMHFVVNRKSKLFNNFYILEFEVSINFSVDDREIWNDLVKQSLKIEP